LTKPPSCAEQPTETELLGGPGRDRPDQNTPASRRGPRIQARSRRQMCWIMRQVKEAAQRGMRTNSVNGSAKVTIFIPKSISPHSNMGTRKTTSSETIRPAANRFSCREEAGGSSASFLSLSLPGYALGNGQPVSGRRSGTFTCSSQPNTWSLGNRA